MLGNWKVGLATVADVRARCVINPTTHCWEWQGARQYRTAVSKGMPVMHAFDHARGEKRTMSGPLAVWNIAHGRSPLPGYKVFRACCCTTCVNPAHLREAKDDAEIGLHQRRSGLLRGRTSDARRANVLKAQAAAGIVYVTDEAVAAIRSAPPDVTGVVLAQRLGISEQSVSRIRRGLRRCDVRERAAE